MVVPAALENQIDETIAKQMRCKIVTEAANGPTTPEGDAVLEERGIIAIPDILANAGVTVSYFEWVQNLQGLAWSLEEVNNKLDSMMVGCLNEVWDLAAELKTNLRTAGFVLAIKRVLEAMKLKSGVLG